MVLQKNICVTKAFKKKNSISLRFMLDVLRHIFAEIFVLIQKMKSFLKIVIILTTRGVWEI